MKSVLIIACLLLTTINISFAESSSSGKIFYKRFEGTVDKLPIVMNLTIIDDAVLGNYYYKKYGIPIEFNYDCSYKNGKLTLVEYSTGNIYDTNDTTGIMELSFSSDSTLTGFWINPKNNKKLECNMLETYPENSAKIEMKKLTRSQGEITDTTAHAVKSEFFPNFSNLSETIQNKILASLAKELGISDFKGKDLEGYIDIQMRKYLEDYNLEIADILPDTSIPAFIKSWQSEQKITVYFNSNNILSFEIFNYSYSGGAHGNYNTNYINFDLTTGEKISWDNFIDNKNKTVLDSIAKKIIWQRFKIKNDKEQAENFWFANNQFKLNDNSAITSGGLKFLFNPYEVAAYAVGQIKVFIPFKDIKNVLKENTLARRIIK